MNADYSYEILTTYFSIEEKNGDSIQLNFISWNKQDPKYDLRRWRNGKPLKGISLTEDTLKAICEAMSRIPIEAEEKKENTRSNDEVVERPSVRRILREKVLGIVSKPEYSESQLRIEDLIGEQAVVNYLLRNNISSLSGLAKGIIDGSIKFTSNKEIKVYEALIKFDENAPEEIRGEDRRLFIGINKAYYEWPISVITPFLDTKEAKKITGRLLSGGYDTLGKLEGALESSLERIVGRNKSCIFIEAERILTLEPEQIVAEMWERKVESRAISIILERSRGRSFKEISEEEGVSRERIRQMILAFYAGQDPFLLMLREEISGSDDKIATLQKLFTEEKHRIFFINWVRMIAHSEDFEFDEAVEKDRTGYKDIKDYYQMSLFDL